MIIRLCCLLVFMMGPVVSSEATTFAGIQNRFRAGESCSTPFDVIVTKDGTTTQISNSDGSSAGVAVVDLVDGPVDPRITFRSSRGWKSTTLWQGGLDVSVIAPMTDINSSSAFLLTQAQLAANLIAGSKAKTSIFVQNLHDDGSIIASNNAGLTLGNEESGLGTPPSFEPRYWNSNSTRMASQITAVAVHPQTNTLIYVGPKDGQWVTEGQQYQDIFLSNSEVPSSSSFYSLGEMEDAVAHLAVDPFAGSNDGGGSNSDLLLTRHGMHCVDSLSLIELLDGTLSVVLAVAEEQQEGQNEVAAKKTVAGVCQPEGGDNDGVIAVARLSSPLASAPCRNVVYIEGDARKNRISI